MNPFCDELTLLLDGTYFGSSSLRSFWNADFCETWGGPGMNETAIAVQRTDTPRPVCARNPYARACLCLRVCSGSCSCLCKRRLLCTSVWLARTAIRCRHHRATRSCEHSQTGCHSLRSPPPMNQDGVSLSLGGTFQDGVFLCSSSWVGGWSEIVSQVLATTTGGHNESGWVPPETHHYGGAGLASNWMRV